MVAVAEVAGVGAQFAGLGRVTSSALLAGFVTPDPFLLLGGAHDFQGGAVVGGVIGLADWAGLGGNRVSAFYRGLGWGPGLPGLAGTGLVQARVVNGGKGHVCPVSPPISSVRLITVFCFSLPRFGQTCFLVSSGVVLLHWGVGHGCLGQCCGLRPDAACV